MSQVQVQIPAGVHPGQPFQVQAGGQVIQVTCPPGSGPGQIIVISVPATAAVQAMQPPPGSPAYMFRMIDTDRSGALNVVELQKALSSASFRFDVPTVKMMINMFDVDRGGTIDEREFCGLFAFLNQWKQCYDSFDTDRSGTIDFNELSRCMVAFGYKLAEPTLRFIFKTYDTDGNGTVAFDEYIQICCELQMLTGDFKKLDPAGTGTINVAYEQFLLVAFKFKR